MKYILVLLDLIKNIVHLPNTLYFNFKVLPFRQAVKLPIGVHKNVVFNNLAGRVSLKKEYCSYKMATIGFLKNGLTDTKNTSCVLKIEGKVIIEGVMHLGLGSKISVEKNRTLFLGNNLVVTGNTTIICHKSIVIEKDCLLSWGITIMDTDSHKIYNRIDSQQINTNKAIHIGQHVWIGSNAFIAKGATIPNNCVIGTNTFINKEFTVQNTVIAGNPARIVKENISWEI